MSTLTIPQHLRDYRRRALEAQANNGVHAWDLTPGAWDSDREAEAYCLDAIDSMPAGSTKHYRTDMLTSMVLGTRIRREA